jgi:hypothetical protein
LGGNLSEANISAFYSVYIVKIIAVEIQSLLERLIDVLMERANAGGGGVLYIYVNESIIPLDYQVIVRKIKIF